MWSNSRAHWMLSGVLFIFVFCHQWCLLFANHVHNHHNTHSGTHTKWFRTEILDGNGLFILDWRKTTKDIIFRATVNTRGYIGIGFSYKSEKIADADIILAWVDDRTGEPNVLVNKLYVFCINITHNFGMTSTAILARNLIQFNAETEKKFKETQISLASKNSFAFRMHC